MLMTGRYPLQKRTKQLHEKKILLELFDHQPLSRGDLADKLSLSLTAVSALVDDLQKSGLVTAYKKDNTACMGRPPEWLELVDTGAYFLTVAARRSGLKGAAYDLRLHRTESFFLPYPPESGIGAAPESGELPRISSEKFAELVSAAIRTHFSDEVRAKAQAIVFSMPGTRTADGTEFLSVPLKRILTGDFPAELTRQSGIPVTFGNGSDFCAYAEKPSVGRGGSDFLYVSLHYGVGAGVICGGTIFQIGSGHSTEFGHMSIDYNGRPCSCGGRGCLERYVGFEAIISAMQARTGEALTVEQIAQRYRAGDEDAGAVMADAAQKLIFGLSNMTSVFRLERVIFGGGIEQFGPQFLDCLRRTLAQSAVRPQMHRTELCYSTLDEYGELFGAARYVLEQVWLPAEA